MAAIGRAQIFLLASVLVGAGCTRSGGREYQLTGQILSVDPARQEVTIKHEDIPRFMPGMTMAFRVHDGRLLQGRVPGDLVTATLVVDPGDVHLRTLRRTGFAAVASPAVPAGVMDLLARGEPAADASFTNERGIRARLADWRGRILAVTFMYTRCPVPDFCPLMDRQFKVVQDQVRADPALRGRVRLLSVTLDPAHDTPAVLAKHAVALDADPAIWHFLSGTREELMRFASQFGVSTVAGDGGTAEIVHNLRTAVIDADGRLAAVLSGAQWTPAELVAALRNARAGQH